MDLRTALRFYFITDDRAPGLAPIDQVRAALKGGATFIQYRRKQFAAVDFAEAAAIRDLCRINRVPFVVNDHLLLAKAVDADGLHLGQDDETPAVARQVLGSRAIIGISVSDGDELARTDLAPCNYVGSGPVFATGTKADAKPVRGLTGLKEIVDTASLPVVAIGGIDADRAPECLARGAAGVAVISAVTRAPNPQAAAVRMAAACGCPPRDALDVPWQDEFALIRRLVAPALNAYTGRPALVPPGDDAARLDALPVPVISTDTQREGVHFYREWQSPENIGIRAVEITLSDLAACYADPVSLFVNLGLPNTMAEREVTRLYDGLHAALRRHNCRLGGGNIARSPVLGLDLFAVGQGRRDLFPRRNAAHPGETLYATGPLGLARCGLKALERGDPRFPDLVARFLEPRARFDAAAVLAAHGIACVMDISDGLAGDAAHIARAANLTIDLDAGASAEHPELRRFCTAHGLNPDEEVLAGGEDYELLFTCRPQTFASIVKHLPEAHPVGRCRPFDDDYLTGLPDGVRSFQHG
ncbi:MAG: thiamine-phosphate kinase [Desulfobacterales bacterium]|nr:thiamine-phosphate kinase [Desulfobacterales bacterium]